MKTDLDSRNCLLLCGLVFMACLLCVPFAETGVNDDWSYIKTAQDLARTGDLVYNGWAAAMIGAQAYWGALFALLFGKESFTAVRLSVVPLALGTVALFYALCRRCNVAPVPAFFGTLTLGLSPMFIPYAVTFMTDMPGLFLMILGVYAYTRASEEQKNLSQGGATLNRFSAWLSLATVAGMASGTVRQTGWILPVLAAILLLSDAFRSGTPVPKLKPLLVIHAVALAVSVLFAVVANQWFSRQPYAVHEELGTALAELARTGVERFPAWRILPAGVAYTLVMLALPILPFVWETFLPRKKSSIPLPIFLVTVAVLLLLQAWGEYLPPRRMFPWIQNTVTETELWWYYIVGEIGRFPVFFTKPQRYVFSYLIVGLTSLLLAKSFLVAVYSRLTTAPPSEDKPSPFAVRLFKTLALVYMPLLVVKLFVHYSFGVLDRYVLPLLPGLILFLLCQRSQIEPNRLSRWSCILLLSLYAYYGVGRTHDCFAQRRAVMAISDRLTHFGIPRTLIKGGLEYNGWTQITTAGYYNDPRIVYPVGAYSVPKDTGESNKRDPFWFYTPRVTGVFYILATRLPDLSDTATPPEPYDCWLPPFRREVFLQTSDPRFKTFAVPSLP